MTLAGTHIRGCAQPWELQGGRGRGPAPCSPGLPPACARPAAPSILPATSQLCGTGARPRARHTVSGGSFGGSISLRAKVLASVSVQPGIHNPNPSDGGASPVPQEADKPQGEGLFEWQSNWYAVASAKDLDPSRPHALTVMGHRVVLWKDRERQRKINAGEVPEAEAGRTPTAWSCFLDRCPHRLVPLSEGRIDEQGLLQCSYHGWTFAGDGACQGIPQAAPTGPEQKTVGSPKACATPLPITEELGILFVWPDASPGAAARAASTVPPLPAGVDKGAWRLSPCARELQYGYEMLAENVMDPAHLPFAHHGVGPLRREQGAPYPHASIISEREGVSGFVGRLFESNMPTFSPVEFQAPGLFVYYRSLAHSKGEAWRTTTAEELQRVKEATLADVESGSAGAILLTALYITPVAPGRSRVVALEGSNTVPRGIFRLIQGTRWLGHLFLQQVLDGDAYFLHAQEKVLQGIQAQGPTGVTGAKEDNQGSTSLAKKTGLFSLISSAYFLPTSADRFVIGFRRWLDKFGGGKVEWPQAEYRGAVFPQELAPKTIVLDRFGGHTASCLSCQTALVRFQVAQKVLLAASVAVFLIALHVQVGPIARAVLFVACAGIAAIGAQLQKVTDLFVYTGYDHAST